MPLPSAQWSGMAPQHGSPPPAAVVPMGTMPPSVGGAVTPAPPPEVLELLMLDFAFAACARAARRMDGGHGARCCAIRRILRSARRSIGWPSLRSATVRLFAAARRTAAHAPHAQPFRPVRSSGMARRICHSATTRHDGCRIHPAYQLEQPCRSLAAALPRARRCGQACHVARGVCAQHVERLLRER